MKIIVGLGNPGKKFQKTPHNLGFRVLNLFLKENRDFFSNFKQKNNFLAKISEGKMGKEKIILAKPQTFMNNSGKAVKKIISHFLRQGSDLFVVHDDIDLSLGKIKISYGKGSAGHKGVQSVIEELKTKNFFRFRIGVMPAPKSQFKIEDFVLKNFTEKEEKIIKKIIKKTIEAINFALKEGVKKAMTKFNK